MHPNNDEPEAVANKAHLRRMAEQQFQASAAGSPALSTAEVAVVTQELHIHQIELEMQNEELRRAQAALEASQARYIDLYDLAPVGYVTLNEKGLILEANLTAATLLGVARTQLVNRLLSDFILPEDQDSYYRYRHQLLETGAPQACELQLLGANAAPFWALLEATVARADDGTPTLRAVLSDNSARKQVNAVQRFLAQTSSAATAESFFNTLARYLAQSLAMDFVCIDRLEGDGLLARTLAVWCDGRFEDNVTYALKDTPCGDVVGQHVCCFPANVCQFFPRDQVLQDLRADSYLGATLWDHTGQPIGLIALISRKSMVNRSLAEEVLKLVSLRAGSELERMVEQAALQLKYAELERINRVTMGRELRMIELKAEINALLEAAGQPAKYKIV